MTTATDNTAWGKVSVAREGLVVFSPAGTNYEMQLVCPRYVGLVNTPTRGIIRVKARKIYTVPSGGLFIEPVFGPPRNIQGRIIAIDQRSMVIHAGGAITVDLPDDDAVYEMVNGNLTIGKMVKVVAWPGATFEPVAK